jgi:hypothetical protein
MLIICKLFIYGDMHCTTNLLRKNLARNCDSLGYELNFLNIIFMLLQGYIYCTWCTDKQAGKITHVSVYIPIRSSLSVLNFMLPACGQNFSVVFRTT